MIDQKDILEILKNYDLENVTIGVLGGHSALDVLSGAKKQGFKTLAVCQKGREKTYGKYYKTKKDSYTASGEAGCVDEIILVDKFSDITKPEIQEQLRKKNTIFIHNRYFWVYFDFAEIENTFKVPIFGSRTLVKLEERDQPKNQYYLLNKAGIRTPSIIAKNDLDKYFKEGGSPLIVKTNEVIRGYERAFFVITSQKDFEKKSNLLIEEGKITKESLEKAQIEEFIVGAQINFNYFYCPLENELEIMGTDMRRQTSMDGFLRLDAKTQIDFMENGYTPSMIETGHVAVTVKESLLEKAFEAGEKFVETLKKEVSPGIIGPFALQGAISSMKGKEEFVVFDVSMRIPGSPGTRFTPYTSYLYGESISYGERIALEIRKALDHGRVEEILT